MTVGFKYPLYSYKGMSEKMVVTIDDEFIENFSAAFAERTTPIVNDIIQNKHRLYMKYTYFAVGISLVLGFVVGRL